MNIFDNFQFVPKEIEKRHSKINGKISVVKFLGQKPYIQIGGLTQSGGIVKEIWYQTLEYQKNKGVGVKKSLVLGLGGGCLAECIKTLWGAKVTGVEIDSVMLELGKKYLGLEENCDVIKNVDASKFLTEELKEKPVNKYDLICVDMYLGDKVPPKFEKMDFFWDLKKLMKKKGVLIVNRLFFDGKKTQALEFGDKICKVFKTVEYYYPKANVMLICKD